MKNRSLLFFMAAILVITTSSCSVFKKSNKEGCPSDGRNVGAEKVLANEGSKKKSPKFRGTQSY
jgi:hypothetical protein